MPSTVNAHAEVKGYLDSLSSSPLKTLLYAVYVEASREILRCLDPRHGTSFRQAEEAVYTYDAPAALLAYVRAWRCTCAVGAQECPTHPDNLRTKEEKISFRIAFDERVEEGRP